MCDRRWAAAAVLLLVSLTGPLSAQQAAPWHDPLPRKIHISLPTSKVSQPRAEQQIDLAIGPSFTFNIAPELPRFTFKIVPRTHSQDSEGSERATVQNVEVFVGNSKQALQRLASCDLDGMEAPPAAETDPPWFHAEDINFDGYNDISLLTNWGASGNQTVCVWLYNRKTGRFDYSGEFSQLGRHWPDPATKTIVTAANGGADNHSAERYKVENGRPVLIYSESQGQDQQGQLHCVVRERHGNAMTTVFDKRDPNPMKECDGGKASPPPSRVILPGDTVRVIG